MGIKAWIKRIPFAVPVYRKIAAVRRSRSNKKILRQLESTPYREGRQIWKALMSLQDELPESDRDWKGKIEFERERLLKRSEPLDDGSLGKAGLYDKDKTVKAACQVSKPPKPALLLFLLTRFLEPETVIELGTNVGISSAYIGAGLKVNGQNGKITTLDASPYRQRLAKEVHRNLDLDNITYVNGLFTDTLRPTLNEFGPIDLAFIDGHHQFQPTLNYFEEILDFSTSDAVFVFDDIRWSDGMKKAWARIQSDERLGLIVDLSSVGICTRRQHTNSPRFVFKPIRGLFEA